MLHKWIGRPINSDIIIAMMATAELDSFVLKFKCLINAGHEAFLNVGYNDGKLCVDLKAEIAFNDVQGWSPLSTQKRMRNPSYQRRQERRRAEQAAATTDANIVHKEENDSAVKFNPSKATANAKNAVKDSTESS